MTKVLKAVITAGAYAGSFTGIALGLLAPPAAVVYMVVRIFWG